MPGSASARPIVRSMANLSLPPTAFERIDDLIREIGTLIVALTPLDLGFSTEVEGKILTALLLSQLGLFLFGVALVIEHRRKRG